MIVKSCYIENFGTLHEVSFDFTDGINVIKEENGWGKSTLAVFIKSMFYGMEYSRKRSVLTEFNKYAPWQGGGYGGYLIFSAGGKEYKVVRYFDKKECIFELYDTLTNKPSKDYSERLGEELFGIDCASFERSIFIKLDSDNKMPGLSDSISAKLNNLVDNTDDVNNFQSAYDALDKLAASVIPRRGSNGMVGRAEERIRDISAELFECDNADREITLLRGKVHDIRKRREELREQESRLVSELDKFALLDTRARYTELEARKNQYEKRLDGLSEFFKNGVPSDTEIAEHTREVKEAEIYASRLDSEAEEKRRRLNEAENFFAGHIPAEADIMACRSNLAEYNRLRDKLSSLKPSSDEAEKYRRLAEKYNGKLPAAAELDRYEEIYNRALQLTAEIDAKNEQLSDAKPARGFNMAAAACAVIAILGIIFTVTVSTVMAKTFMAVIAAAGIVGFIISLRRGGRTHTDGLEIGIVAIAEERDELEKQCTDFAASCGQDADMTNMLSALSKIRMEINDAEKLGAKIRKYNEELKNNNAEPLRAEIEDLLSRYTYERDGMDYSEKLAAVSDALHTYTYLSREVSAHDAAFAALNALNSRLQLFFGKYAPQGNSDFERMQYMRDMTLELKDVSEKAATARAELDAFIQTHDISGLRDAAEPSADKEELTNALNQCRAMLSAAADEQSKTERDIERHGAAADRRQELESERARLTEEKARLIARHGILSDTMALLSEAKENLTSKYMREMTPAFNKYISMLGHDREQVVLTAELETQLESNGRQYESGYHSRGYADMVNICTRLALADVMYKEETPFIVLDDPFVNLDDEKVSRGLEFLKQLGREKQILYFTCHKSRSLD